MKKLFILIAFLTSCIAGNACDICGCGVGGNYIGVLPEFQKNIIGLRYRYNALQSHLGVDGNSTYLTATEHYHTAELWGGFNIGKKVRLLTAVPYAFNERINQGISKSKNGFADVSITGYYQLLNNRNTISKKLLVQSLWLGVGIKLPTGKYLPEDKQNSNQNANLFQLGTGSFDFTLNTMYDIRLQDAGLNINLNYKLNSSNKYEYRYGNKLNSSAQFYYKLRVKNKYTLAPNAGINYETSAKDLDDGFTVDVSGGNILMGTIGMETIFNKLSVGANWQVPMAQNLANGSVKANNRLMLHVSVPF